MTSHARLHSSLTQRTALSPAKTSWLTAVSRFRCSTGFPALRAARRQRPSLRMIDRATRAAVRIGVAGAGAIGRRHVQYCVDEPGTALIGIADPASDSASLAREFGVPHFRFLEDLLDAQCVDGIIVAVPTPLHCKVALTAIRRGI